MIVASRHGGSESTEGSENPLLLNFFFSTITINIINIPK
jgi:hypothetical protein